jgi:hypothetical protein
MTFFRNSFLIFLSFIPYTIMASEPDAHQLQVCVQKSEIIKYFIPDNTGFCFVDKKGTETKGPFSFGILQNRSHMGTPLGTLTVVWNVAEWSIGIKKQTNKTQSLVTPATDGAEFYLSSRKFTDAVKNYKQVVKKLDLGQDQTVLTYNATPLDGTLPEVQLLTTVMKSYAQERLLTLKYNNRVLYKPSTMQYAAAWISSHKKSVCLGIFGCLSVALYFMLKKNSSNRLLINSNA